jgi:ParB family chromosome partitioning protein
MRKTLGRGLDALIGEPGAENGGTVSGAGGARLAYASVNDITKGPFQPRLHFDEDKLEELKRAIQSQGIIEPLIVRRIGAVESDGPHFELIAGERRLRAARAAGLETVPVVVRELDDRAALEMSLVENIAREDLSPVEEAFAFARLVKHFELSHDEIAVRVGKSRPYVSNAIRLLSLAPEVIEMLACGQLTSGQARPLLAIGSPQAQLSAARRISAMGISARDAEDMTVENRAPSGFNAKSRGRLRSSGDANVNALAEGLQRALKRKVRIFKRRGRSPGRIEIEYYDENDLTAVAEMLLGNSRASMRA